MKGPNDIGRVEEFPNILTTIDAKLAESGFTKLPTNKINALKILFSHVAPVNNESDFFYSYGDFVLYVNRTGGNSVELSVAAIQNPAYIMRAHDLEGFVDNVDSDALAIVLGYYSINGSASIDSTISGIIEDITKAQNYTVGQQRGKFNALLKGASVVGAIAAVGTAVGMKLLDSEQSPYELFDYVEAAFGVGSLPLVAVISIRTGAQIGDSINRLVSKIEPKKAVKPSSSPFRK